MKKLSGILLIATAVLLLSGSVTSVQPLHDDYPRIGLDAPVTQYHDDYPRIGLIDTSVQPLHDDYPRIG